MSQRKLLDTIQHIDCAIVFSSHSCFYIYQKIKFLFALNETAACSAYILDQLHFLYQHASLYILCKALYYYQKLNALSSEHLKQLLIERSVPYALADEYQNILESKTSNLLYYAKKASNQDDFLLCIDYCTLILKKNKHSLEALYLSGQAYHMLGHLHQACEYYNKCIQVDPQYDLAYNDLGLALMELGSFPEALEALNKAKALHPGNIDYLAHISECYYALKKYDLAQLTLESIIKICPSHLQIYFNLSYVCRKQNKKRLSKKYMKIAQKQLKA
ncbi:tetratricopeptide repeat protein [Cellulosilyticum sp. I15G10I2]|uniref:tetratricopeptide repeat protein n=1 Tax=Cellulosilyticum sp. I15G10I2 TaxID=1892843 RepID=UPI00085CC2EB|nr:tetratricopeptide repeat protein [Cellulosilyticum sp. I15G10I2]